MRELILLSMMVVYSVTGEMEAKKNEVGCVESSEQTTLDCSGAL